MIKKHCNNFLQVEKSEDGVVSGKFNGAVTVDTVKAVNNILKENCLPYLMILSELEEKRGTTLNENFHRFIGGEIGINRFL